MRDPSSAEFRGECVAELWTVEGSRAQVYCAEVNANNGFGGKAGYQPVMHIISHHYATPHQSNIFDAGRTWINPHVDGNFRNWCMRPPGRRTEAELNLVSLD